MQSSKTFACAMLLAGAAGSLGGCSGAGSDGSSSPAGSWTYVAGSAGSLNHDPAFGGTRPQLTAFGSKLYAIWNESNGATRTSHIRAAVYNGNDARPGWAPVDGDGANGLNEDPAGNAFSAQLTVFDSKLYAAWHEVGAQSQVKVAVYGGNDASPSWTFVHGDGPTGLNVAAKPGRSAQLTVLGSRLYATWVEAGQARVAVYAGDDGAPAWTRVDGGAPDVGLNTGPDAHANESQLTAFASKLYATWDEDGLGTNQIRVAVYGGDDASPSWRLVDAGGLKRVASELSGLPQLTPFGSKLYATWLEANAGVFQVRVAVYGGDDASPTWSFVDGNGPNGINHDPPMQGLAPQLTAFGSKLHAVWEETEPGGTSYDVRVAAYGGNDAAPSWEFVDGDRAHGLYQQAGSDASYGQLTVFDSKLYATWREIGSGAAQIRVAVKVR